MKVTNKLHLPEAFVQAVSVERHNKAGCYSATTLNKGVKEIVLQERHWDEFTVDAADSVWAAFGTAFHAVMEKYEDGCFREEKFDVPVGASRVTGVVSRGNDKIRQEFLFESKDYEKMWLLWEKY